MKKFSFIFIILSFFSSADILDNLNDCKKIENNNTRLKCYDNISKKETLTNDNNSTTVTKNNKGKWQEFTNIDPMTDKKVIVLSLDAEKPIYTKLSFEENIPSLYIRCKNNKTEAYISWNAYLGIDTTRVTYRIDKQKKHTLYWAVSTDYKASFAPSGYRFAKKLLNHKKLVVSLTPYGDNPVTTVFNISGFENAATNLKKLCNWH